MNRRITFLFWFFISSNLAFAQIKKGPSPDPLLFGVQYDILANKSSQWKNDFGAISGRGFQIVNFTGQFWPSFEAQEGIYDFKLLEEAIESASKQSLKAIVTIPVSTIPRWFFEKHTDGWAQTRDGMIRGSSARNPVSVFFPPYQPVLEKWLEQISKKFGKDKRVAGWMLGIDYNQLSTEFDYCQHVRWPFIQWLGKKYDNIENLNQAWATSSRGYPYSSFQQVNLPTASEAGLLENPAVQYDWKQFVAESLGEAIKKQGATLRKNTDKSQWISCEFQPWQINGNPFLDVDLDFPSISYNPASAFPAGYGPEGYRINDPFSLGFPLDQFVSKNGKTAISSFQLGSKGQPIIYPGSTRLLLFRSWAAGASHLVIQPFRLGNDGSSAQMGSLIGADYQNGSSVGVEISKAIKEITTMNGQLKPQKELPENLKQLKTGLLVKRENGWDQSINKKNDQWNHLLHLSKYYEALKSLQVPVEFISEETDLSAYKIIIAPSYSMVSAGFSDKLLRFSEKGGTLILSCRFAEKDEKGERWPENKNHPLQKLTGIESRLADVLPSNRAGKIGYEGKSYEWNNWGEILTTEKSTQTLGIFGDQFYKNATGIVKKTQKQGTVFYIGVETDGFQLEKEILKSAIQKASGNALEELPRGLEVYYRNGIWMALNFHSSETRKYALPPTAKILLGSPEIKPCEVLVWTEK